MAHYFESLGKVQTIYMNIFGRAIFLLAHNEKTTIVTWHRLTQFQRSLVLVLASVVSEGT